MIQYPEAEKKEKVGNEFVENNQLYKEKVGLNLIVFCQVTLQVHSKKLITQFEHAIERMPEVIGCFHVAGNFDYLLKIVTPNIKSYQSLLKNKLSVLESVSNVQSNFVMSSVKENAIYELA